MENEEHYPVAYTNRRQCCVVCDGEDGRPEIWPCRKSVEEDQ